MKIRDDKIKDDLYLGATAVVLLFSLWFFWCGLEWWVER